MKIIQVETCRECAHKCYPCGDTVYTVCRKASKDILDIDSIPDWCPLEDAPAEITTGLRIGKECERRTV